MSDGQAIYCNSKIVEEESFPFSKIEEGFSNHANTLKNLPEIKPEVTESNAAEILAGEYINPKSHYDAPPVSSQVYANGEVITIGTQGNFSAIIGKAKSRKTFFVSILAAALITGKLILNTIKGCLPPENKVVGYFDTEQSKYHVSKVVRRICRLAVEDNPDNLKAFGLRKYTPDERLLLIEHFIYNTPGLGCVILDGIRDLVTSINDEEQATIMTSKLLKWTEEKNIHIIVVLHQNKSDTNARGHLGTEVINKAETVISITKQSENKEISIVESEFCRDKEFTPFGFSIDNEGLPCMADHWELKAEKYDTQKGITALEVPLHTHKEALKKAFTLTPKLRYKQLVDQLKLAFEALGQKKIGDNKIKTFIEYYKNEKLLSQEGKIGTASCMYSLSD